MNESIKIWYQKNYPMDELGAELPEHVTFWNLFYHLDSRKCVYELILIHDSIVRERLFERFATLINADYDYIYEQWLLGA